MARMIVADHDYVTKKYNLHKLKELEELVAEAVEVFEDLIRIRTSLLMRRQVNLPFNNPITGFCVRDLISKFNALMVINSWTQAFTHKAGIHAKAILNSKTALYGKHSIS